MKHNGQYWVLTNVLCDCNRVLSQNLKPVISIVILIEVAKNLIKLLIGKIWITFLSFSKSKCPGSFSEHYFNENVYPTINYT